MDKQKCNDCEEDKVKIFSRVVTYKGDGKNRNVYVNENGFRWNARQCPDCFTSKKTKRRLREKLYTCKVCNLPMEVNRFFHFECLYGKHLRGTIDETFTYC